MLQFLIIIFLVLIIAGFILTQKNQRHVYQKEFLSGKMPEILPDGFFKGTAPHGYYGSWRGKKIDAKTATGTNVFFTAGRGEEDKYHFKIYKDKGLEASGLTALFMDYALPENPFWARPILDEMVEIAPGKYLGKIHLRLIPGFPFTLGYFRLEK